MSKIKDSKFFEKYLFPIILVIITFALPLIFPAIKNAYIKIILFLLSKVTIEGYLLIIFGLLSFFSLLVLINQIIIKLKKNTPDKPYYRAYFGDKYANVFWKWNYFQDAIDKSTMTAFCPDCLKRLVSTMYSGRTVFFCDGCHKELWAFPGNISETKDHVFREMEKRINTELWKVK